MNKFRVFLTKPGVTLLILASIFLSACGVGVANSNWPGMATDEGVVYVAFGQGLMAIDIAAGEQLWFYRPADASATLQFYAAPSVEEGQIVIGDYGASGGLLNPNVKVSVYSLESEDNAFPSTKWIQSEHIQDKVVAPPLTVGEQIFVGTADNIVVALDAADGRPVWNEPFEAEHSIWGRSAYEDGVLYVPSLDKNVYALDSETGRELWQTNVGGSVSDRVVLDGDLLFIGSFDHNLYALDKKTGDVVWTAPAEAAIWGAPAVSIDAVYYADLNGNVFAADIGTGEAIWEAPVRLNSYTVAAPIFSDSKVFLATAGDPSQDMEVRNGMVVALDANDGSELWRQTTDKPVYSTPVIADESLVIAPLESDVLVNAYDLNSGDSRLTCKFEESEELTLECS